MFLQTLIASVAIFVLLSGPVISWDGIDSETGAQVDIEQGNLVRSGRDIEVFDYDTGEYHDITVDDINRRGGSVEVNGYDNTTGEYRSFEFDD